MKQSSLIERITHHYEYLLGCVQNPMYWVDMNGQLISCNSSFLNLLGQTSVSPIKGLNIEQIGAFANWAPPTTLLFKNDIDSVIKTGKPLLHAIKPPILSQNSALLTFSTNHLPMLNQTNTLVGVIGVLTNISELKQNETKLKQANDLADSANQAKTVFLNNISHGFKTPLAGIIGAAELLATELADKNHELANTILNSSRQLLTFIDICLDAAKHEKGSDSALPERFELLPLAEEICQLFQSAIQTKGIVFNLQFDKSIPQYLLGDSASTHRILLNLLENAVKFTSHGAILLTIDLCKQPSSRSAIIKITVKDTGIGIAEEKQKQIFELFSRLTPSYKGTYEGTGMGLYTVQKLVETMGGEIYLKSDEGSGCEFSVVLPFQLPLLDVGEYQNSSLSESLESLPIRTTKKRQALASAAHKAISVLLVEDNIIAQRMESSLLATINCQVTIAESGEIALELFEAGKYDLMLLDIGLPGIQGDAVSKLVRKIELGSQFHIPIIALTAHISDDAREIYLAQGIDEVISKPLSRDQAVAVINQFVCP